MAAHELGIPLDGVFIAETATDKVPNASPTAASASSDMYGGAVMDACRQINERLAPYRKEAKENATFAVRSHFYSSPSAGFAVVSPICAASSGLGATLDVASFSNLLDT